MENGFFWIPVKWINILNGTLPFIFLYVALELSAFLTHAGALKGQVHSGDLNKIRNNENENPHNLRKYLPKVN